MGTYGKIKELTGSRDMYEVFGMHYEHQRDIDDISREFEDRFRRILAYDDVEQIKDEIFKLQNSFHSAVKTCRWHRRRNVLLEGQVKDFVDDGLIDLRKYNTQITDHMWDIATRGAKARKIIDKSEDT